MCSLGDAETTSSSSTVHFTSSLNANMDVDDRITDLLDSLRWHCLRGKSSQDRDDDRLRRLHRQLEAVINEEPDDCRRRRLRHILPAANCIREQLLFLRQSLHSATPLSTSVYVSRAHVALSEITKHSEEEEYRKLATIVGVLEAVAENLVLEVDAFGVDCAPEHREIRKLIASALTNLTFGNAQSKRRLCSYPNLIEYVIRVIDDSHKLAQVYAGLLRNLSWMADAEMSATLSPTVSSLTRASLRAYRANESKCLCATLSALWNLASHSRENKKSICEQSGFLDMIVELLTTDAQHTTLVEPASGVLKYASMYLAAVGASQLLSTSALHKMVLRLVDLLNSPSFTIIGNALGVLSQLLAKDHQLRVHVRLNHKAMQLLNHLRNSTRDDIRNAVKTVLDYLNSADLSAAFAPHYSFAPTATSVAYRADGMSSSYGGTGTDTTTFMDPPRRLKLRSAHSHAPPSLLTTGLGGAEATPSLFAFPGTSCAAAAMQHGFAPRPGERQTQQFASLPRQCFHQQSNSSFGTPMSMMGGQLVGEVQMESTSSQTSAFVTSGAAVDVDGSEDFEDSELVRLDLRSDDPSFEVEDSVRCTRCTSTQSLSSLLPGDKSAWESCSNSAINSNRLSPASATDLPDSPTQCVTPSRRELKIPSASDITTKSEKATESSVENDQARNEKQSDGSEKDDQQVADLLAHLVNMQLSVVDQDSPRDVKDEAIKQSSSADDDGDYGSFIGRADSELLNQSIEAAMPKRIETSEDFLADMIEQVQPKASPRSRRQPNAGRNFSSASTARVHSAASSMKNDDDFLLQSIASVLPQSSNSRRDHWGSGSPPKKARAVTGDTARASTGPKRSSHAVQMTQTRTCACALDVTANDGDFGRVSLQVSSGESACGCATMSSSAALFDAALQSSSLVESTQTSEKVRDACSLIHHLSTEESDTLSDDNYSRFGDDEETVDTMVPEDVDEEFRAEQLLIDCNVVVGAVRHEAVRPAKKMCGSRIALPTRGPNVRSELPKMQRSGSSGPSGFNTATSTRTAPWSSVLRDDATRRSVSASATPKKRLVSAKPAQIGVALDLEKQSTVRSSRTSKMTDENTVLVSRMVSQARIKPTMPPKLRTAGAPSIRSAGKSDKSKLAQPRVHVKERSENVIGARNSIRDQEASALMDSLASEVAPANPTSSRSVRVPPFNYKNPQELATQQCDEKTLNVEKSPEASNSCICDLHDELKKKPNVKQMLVTTV
uniref:Adenomatous polyposis coli protein n=1 Tax=Parascaris univalens TaxID=6257 RepID=A0A914ZPI6_PARUN